MDIRTSQPPKRYRPNRWQIIGIGTVTVSVTAIVTLALRPAGQPADTSAPAPPSNSASALSPTPAVRPGTASVSDLARIADRLIAAPYEKRHTHTDSFEYTDVRVWETTTE